MNTKDYLRQAYRLDHKINSDIEELARLREMSTSVSSTQFSERVQTNRACDAPFARCVNNMVDLENKIKEEINVFLELKQQIRSVIEKVENTDEQMVLRYRYIHNMTWEEIGDELNADKSTVRRWHGIALKHVQLPDNPIVI